MASGITGKVKAARVPLDYFRRAGAGRRRAAWLVVLAALALGGAVAALGSWKQVLSPGPVSLRYDAVVEVLDRWDPVAPETPEAMCTRLLTRGRFSVGTKSS